MKSTNPNTLEFKSIVKDHNIMQLLRTNSTPQGSLRDHIGPEHPYPPFIMVRPRSNNRRNLNFIGLTVIIHNRELSNVANNNVTFPPTTAAVVDQSQLFKSENQAM